MAPRQEVTHEARTPVAGMDAGAAGGETRPGLADEAAAFWVGYGSIRAGSSPDTDRGEPSDDRALRVPSVPIADDAPFPVSGADWRALLERYSDWSVEVMLRIIYGPYPCPNGESGGDPNAISPDGRNIGGLQINLVHGWTMEQLLDPAFNVEAAHDVWLSQGYNAWSCY